MSIPPTQLLYLEDMQILRSQSKIVDLIKDQEKEVVILDRTIFYPQGGGQPYDKGVIQSDRGKFLVEEVRLVEGFVRHIGKFESGHFTVSDLVECIVNGERRHLLSRIHSAGHLLDLAVKQLGLSWEPGKGYHFPEGAYVEYKGSLEGIDKEKLKTDLENKCQQLIEENSTTRILFADKKQLAELCDFVPDYIPADKPARVVMFGDFAVPCGGTHVASLSEIKNMRIRKIKPEKNNIRIGYDVI